MKKNQIKAGQFVVVRGGGLANNELVALKVIENDISKVGSRLKESKVYTDVYEDNIPNATLRMCDKHLNDIVIRYWQDTDKIISEFSQSLKLYGNEKIKGVFDKEEEVEKFVRNQGNKEFLAFIFLIIGWFAIMALAIILKTN